MYNILVKMELTLTGGTSTPTHSNVNVIGNNGSNTIQQGNVSQAHKHTHSSHHNHNHSHQGGGQCCNAHPEPRPIIKICASTLLPTKEAVGRFKTDRIYRMSMLSNIIRGGPYALFIDLMTVLVLDEEVAKTKTNEEAESILKNADPVALTQMLEGYGNDGHTLAHWCAKRGKYIIRDICHSIHEYMMCSLFSSKLLTNAHSYQLAFLFCIHTNYTNR